MYISGIINKIPAAAVIDKQNLSLTDGNFIMLEYIEEFPPIIQNIGIKLQSI